MEFQKITNFLNTTSDNKDLPTFLTKKWVEVYDQLEGNYNVNKEIKIKTSMLRSDLCDFSDADIVVKGNITVTKKAFTADNIYIIYLNTVKVIEKQQVACEVELILTQFKNCVLIDKSTTEANYSGNPVVSEIDNPEDIIFEITDIKLFVPVVSLSKENDIKLLEQLKSGFKRTIKWNKYRSQITIQHKITT